MPFTGSLATVSNSNHTITTASFPSISLWPPLDRALQHFYIPFSSSESARVCVFAHLSVTHWGSDATMSGKPYATRDFYTNVERRIQLILMAGRREILMVLLAILTRPASECVREFRIHRRAMIFKFTGKIFRSLVVTSVFIKPQIFFKKKRESHANFSWWEGNFLWWIDGKGDWIDGSPECKCYLRLVFVIFMKNRILSFNPRHKWKFDFPPSSSLFWPT